MTSTSYHGAGPMSNPTEKEVEEFFRSLAAERAAEAMDEIELTHPIFAHERHIFEFNCDAYEEGEAKSPSWCPDVPPDAQVWAPLCRSCSQLETCFSATQNRIFASLIGWTMLLSDTFDGAIPSELPGWWRSPQANEDFYRPLPDILSHAFARSSGVIENLVMVHGTLLTHLTQENAFLRDVFPSMPGYDEEQVKKRRSEIEKERQEIRDQMNSQIQWALALIVATTRYSVLARLNFTGGDLDGIESVS